MGPTQALPPKRARFRSLFLCIMEWSHPAYMEVGL